VLGTVLELTVAWWELALGGLVVGWIAAFDYVTVWVERFESRVRVWVLREEQSVEMAVLREEQSIELAVLREEQSVGLGAEGGQEGSDTAEKKNRDTTKKKNSILSTWAPPLLFGGVVIPVGCSLVACVLGAVLAHTCGWPFRTGFQYVTSVLAGMANPLTNLNPTTIDGEVVALMVALVALSIEGTLLAMLASMTAVEVMTAHLNGLAELSKVRWITTIDSSITNVVCGFSSWLLIVVSLAGPASRSVGYSEGEVRQCTGGDGGDGGGGVVEKAGGFWGENS
jgi:hypothetical protein